MIPPLLRCPFCGGEACIDHADFIFGTRLSRGQCMDCGAHGREIRYRPGPDDGAEAEADYAAACAWNTRA